MLVFTKNEMGFLEQNELCRLATSSKTGELHIVPVSYVFHDGLVYVVTDYGTRKLRNLRENSNGAVLIDANATRKAVLVSGRVQLIEKGEEYRRIYKLFHSKLAWVRRAPWKEGEAPFVKIAPTFKTSWGLGKIGIS